MAVQYQLLLTALGSAGKTKSQLQEVVGIGLLPYVGMMLRPPSRAGTHIHSANGIFLNSGLTLNETFKKFALNLGGEVVNVEFSLNPDGAKKFVNQWSSEHTNGSIKEILDKG